MCALLLDRVLRGEHKQRSRQRISHAADRHLILLHRFEQGRLRLGRGAVDLVGQDDVGEDGAGDEADFALAGGHVLFDDVGAENVGRHQVWRELDAAELEIHGLGQGLDQQSLGQSRHTP